MIIDEARSETGTWKLATINEIRKIIFSLSDSEIETFLTPIIELIIKQDDGNDQIQVSQRCRYKLAQLCSLLHNYKIPHIDTFLKSYADKFDIVSKNVQADLPLGNATAKLLMSLNNPNFKRRGSANGTAIIKSQIMINSDLNQRVSSKTPEPGHAWPNQFPYI